MRKLGLVAAIGLAAVSLTPASAAASTSARRPASGDAGYAVYGRRLATVETWVKLPYARRFAREMGSVAASVQLWTSTKVIDFKVVACTDTTCRAGGRAVRRDYRQVLDVYNRSSHRLICSTAAKGALQCPGVPPSFNRARIAPGRTVNPTLNYLPPWMFLQVGAFGPTTYDYPLTNSAPSRPTIDFTQARIGVELGSTPWARPALRLPRSAMRLMSFDRPTPPPYAAEVANLRGRTGGIASRWWSHRKVSTSPGRAHAAAAPLWDSGYGITVYLRR